VAGDVQLDVGRWPVTLAGAKQRGENKEWKED